MSLNAGATNLLTQTQRSQTPDLSKAPSSSLAFDWVFTVFVFLISVGLFLDGWSHTEYGPDQSVLSEYHLLFYTSLMTVALWLFANAYLNKREGYMGLKALPAGYALPALGIFIFGLFGVFDLIGHKLFGFEVDFEALFSPSHTGIFIGWALLSAGPARAAMYRQSRQGKSKEDAGWFSSFMLFLPALISWISFTNVLAFFSMNFFASTELWMVANQRNPAPGMDFSNQMMSVMGIILQTAIMFGCLLWLISRFKLPTGSLLVFFTGIGVFTGIIELEFALVPVFVLAAVIAELLYGFLRPNPKRPVQMHAFSLFAALAFWSIFYAFIMLTGFEGGNWLTPYMWTGTIIYGGITALFLSLLVNLNNPLGTLSSETLQESAV